MNKTTRNRIDRSKSSISITEDDLKVLRDRLLPEGSGPLGIMSIACALIELLAEEKNFNLNKDYHEE